MKNILLDFRPCFEHVAAVNARQQSTLDGRCEPETVFLNENVADGAFGDLAAHVQKQHIRKTRFLRSFPGTDVERAVRCLVEEKAIARVGSLRCDANTRCVLSLCRFMNCFVLDGDAAIWAEQ